MRRVLLLAVIAVTSAFGSVTAEEPSGKGATFGETVQQRWRIGVIISAPAGRVTGLTATVPVLTQWPEQEIEIVRRDISKNVRRVTYRDLAGVEQMRISIPKLAAGESATAILEYKITKRYITEPVDKSILELADPVPRKLSRFLSPSPYIESRHESIRKLAPEIVADKAEAWDKVLAIFDWVRAKVKYKFDTQIKSSTAALEDGVGDCEEMTSLFIALCRANGIPARMVWVPQHCYPEFYLQDDDGNGHWFPCQIAGGGREFGRMAEGRPILQKGDSFRVPGKSKPIRYVAPTLTAKNATANPQIKWVIEQMADE